MELKSILRDIPGLQKRFVYYLEAQGYIEPIKIRKSRISRRDYSEEDLKTIQGTWKYYNRGFSLQTAYDLAVRAERVEAFVTFRAPRKNWAGVLEVLKERPEVLEASAVYGDTLDVIAKMSTVEESEIYETLVPLFTAAGIWGVPTVMKARQRFAREKAQSMGENEISAYILMKVPGKHIEEAIGKLKAFPAIVEASAIYGESDIVAKVQVSNPRELDVLVREQIHGLEEVESTRTFIVMGDLHWNRQKISLEQS